MANNNARRLWVDDLRDPAHWGHEGWTWAKTYEDALRCLELGEVLEISLDHDLGDYVTIFGEIRERTGYDVALWMAEHDVWPPEGASSHSANPVGRNNILAVIDRYGPYNEER